MVRRELVSDSLPLMRFNAAVDSGKLRIRTPSSCFLEKVEDASRSVGDVLFLSDVDMQVLALALELNSAGYASLIVTDDYSIQNVANQIGVKFSSLMTFGIRFRLHWILYCPACHRKYPSDYEPRFCKICGTQLGRKPRKRTPVKRRQTACGWRRRRDSNLV